MISTVLLFSFNHPATTEIYTLSLHDALPISPDDAPMYVKYAGNGHHFKDKRPNLEKRPGGLWALESAHPGMEHYEDEFRRSEEHTSELQSRQYLVCRLLLEKKKQSNSRQIYK